MYYKQLNVFTIIEATKLVHSFFIFCDFESFARRYILFYLSVMKLLDYFIITYTTFLIYIFLCVINVYL